MDLPNDYYDQNDSDNVCHLCGKPKYKVECEVETYDFPFTFKECQCGMIKQTPMPNKKFFEWFFNSDLFFSAQKTQNKRIWGFYDYFKDEPCRLATSAARYKYFDKFLGENSRIIKIGPSTGTFLYEAKKHGHDAIGSDISSTFVDYAREHYDVHIDLGRFEEQPYEDASFDAVFLFNVIENIPNLFDFLKAVRAKLKVGGIFALNHVEIEHNIIKMLQKSKYFMYRPPICYMFTSKVLERMLNDNGFEVVEQRRDVRYMHLEKILTLLHWEKAFKAITPLGIHNIPFPIYAYPSKITVARRVS